jgi:N-acyl-D-aspartate/D-glutamate deacylase
VINSSLTGYANVIAQCSDQNLRQTIQQVRDADEQFQYNLYKAAEQKKVIIGLLSKQHQKKFSKLTPFFYSSL